MIKKKKINILDYLTQFNSTLKNVTHKINSFINKNTFTDFNLLQNKFSNIKTDKTNSVHDIKTTLKLCIYNLKQHESVLIKLDNYDNLLSECLKFYIFVVKMYPSFLSSKIDVHSISHSDILIELIDCLNYDKIMFDLCAQLEKHNNSNNTEKYKHLCINCLEMNNLISLLNKTNKTHINKNFTIENLKITNKLVKDELKKMNIEAYESSMFKWKTIFTKISEYIYNKKPFSLFNIRKFDKPLEIMNEILYQLQICNNEYIKKLNTLTNDNFNLMNSHISTCHQISEVKKALSLFGSYDAKNEPINEFNLLQNINNTIYESYNEMVNYNTDLNIPNLKICNEHENSFYMKVNWFIICENIRKYLFFSNPQKFKSKHKYKSIKCSLKSVTVSNNIIEKINKIVLDINEVMIRTYQFIKLYILANYEENLTLPNVTNFDFISMCVRTCCINDTRGNNIGEENNKVLKKLNEFYDVHFKSIYKTKCNVVGYSNILNSCKDEIITAYTNNIKMNFLKFVKKYMFEIFYNLDKNEKEKNSEEVKINKAYLRKQIGILINDDCENNLENSKCEEKYKAYFTAIKNKIFPINSSKKGIVEDIEDNPNKYFSYMIFINKELEKMKAKTFNCFPLRTNVVPSSINMDTLSIITLFTQTSSENKNGKEKGISKILKDNISIFYNKIWESIFNLNGKQFKWNNSYKFNHTISTDGVNITILMVDKNLDGVDLHKEKTNDFFAYVDSLGKTEDGWNKEQMKTEMKKLLELHTLVAIDPGKNPDILHMCNYVNPENSEKVKFFKYTTKQRLHEMDTIKNRKILRKYKNDNKKIIESEKSLNKYSSKTCDLKKFIEYVKIKHETNSIIKPYYEKEFIRKMNLRSYINKLRSETKLVNNIKKIYKENGKEILLVYGDWCRSTQMKGVISTPMIGLKRRLLQDFKIMNFNEFRTSCLDSNTLKKNKEAEVVIKGKRKKLHSVLVSKILNSGSKSLLRFQNRNKNACYNFCTIIDHYVKKGIRHPKFSRETEIEIEPPDVCENICRDINLTTSSIFMKNSVDQTFRYLNVIHGTPINGTLDSKNINMDLEII